MEKITTDISVNKEELVKFTDVALDKEVPVKFGSHPQPKSGSGPDLP